MTVKFQKIDQPIDDKGAATAASLSGGNLGRKIYNQMNYLRNWRYSQPIFTRAGCEAPPQGASNWGELYPILRNITKADTANPERYFSLVAEPLSYFSGDDLANRLRWHGTHATNYWSIVDRDYTAPATNQFTADYSEFPRIDSAIIATSGDLNLGGTIEPFTVTPSTEFEMAKIRYFGMAFRAMSLFEIPNPNLTDDQAGGSVEEFSKDSVIRGDVSPEKNTFGHLFEMLGNSASADTADTIERATRRSWQWCHPFGVWLGFGATGFTSGVFYNVFGNATVKFQPRQIFDDNRKVRITVAVVMTADAGAAFRIRNSTHSSYTYTDTLSSSYTTPTLVTYDAATTGLRVARGEQNELVFEMAYLTSGTKNIKIHSIAVFEEDPFDSVA